ncbi:hypothetical protein Vadar_004814 [Vaccinium darrowii]|uniref:Uncharacterized protein n=1 Tax=Vaccinium darrowii TaxID=229202 RepID=A0ACB7XXM5_9ERIC|nr:hypothetical protein Vadar_004814 [Vaccinium darrowii]
MLSFGKQYQCLNSRGMIAFSNVHLRMTQLLTLDLKSRPCTLRSKSCKSKWKKEEKIEELLDNIDDLETHNVTQEYKDEMVPDEEVERTTIGAYMEILGDDNPATENDKKAQGDPSSLVKGVKKTTTRTEKRLEDFVYPDDKKGNKKKPTKKKEWRPDMSKLFKLMSAEDVESLNQLVAIWTNSSSSDTVALSDIIKLLDDGDVSNSVIDGFALVLENMQEALQKTRGNNVYFLSTCWTLIHSKNPELRQFLLDKKLQHVFDNMEIYGNDYYRFLVFPMNSLGNRPRVKNSNPYHWTILFYDVHEQQWKHYNSLRKRNGADPHLQDVITVKKYVEEFMRSRHGDKTKQSSFNLFSSPTTLFQSHDFNAPITSAQDAPQQFATTVDCGIIVCYIMGKLANHEPIPPSVSQDDVSEFRVHLVHVFLNDPPRSWSIADWSSREIQANLPD